MAAGGGVAVAGRGGCGPVGAPGGVSSGPAGGCGAPDAGGQVAEGPGGAGVGEVQDGAGGTTARPWEAPGGRPVMGPGWD
ncbi:hypothetical protein [Micromonospora sp. NPDC049679]|uniref:hypothetical protein n=1 Tax=Micromonospora sp. NPDC049679 TaxID=3155920 RepID=UPI0033FDED48